ncbi:hypothetical protein BH11MYX3_BH11MYX3_21070 [soil metagenome]
MTVRQIALVVSSVVVLAAGVYLFMEVNSTPATADVTHEKVRPPARPADDERPTKEPETVAARPVTSAPRREMPAPTPPTPSSEPAPALTDNVADELAKPNPKLDAVMAEANKAYDRGEFDEAKSIALKVLAKDPTSIRMMRIVVSSACIDGDSVEAQKHYLDLPAPDREQMKVRCGRYGISFNEK